MLLYHRSQPHLDQVGPYRERMRGTEDIGEVEAQAYKVVNDKERR
jgi:hypothetical protein